MDRKPSSALGPLRLILIRHAHRETGQGRELDNGLSEKGQAQAERLAEALAPRLEGRRAVFWSSPKRRCRETLAPLARRLGAEAQVKPSLDEGAGLNEKIRALVTEARERVGVDEARERVGVDEARERVGVDEARERVGVDEARNPRPPVVVACSHGDWIPTCLQSFFGGMIELRKGGALELRFDEGAVLPELYWLRQRFK